MILHSPDADGKMKTVLFVSLYSEMGGGEVAVYNHLKVIDRARFRPVVMFNASGAFAEKVRSLGVETVIVPFDTVMLSSLISPVRLARLAAASRRVGAYLNENRPDVIACSDVLALLLIGVSVLRLRIPVIYHVIFFYEFVRLLVFNLLAVLLVERIVTNSRTVRSELERSTLFLSRKMVTVYHGVDLDLFHPRQNGAERPLRRELGLAPGVRLVGMVGRFDPPKGHEVFLDAASRLVHTRPDTTFVVIGGVLFGDVFPLFKSYEEKVCRRAEQLDLHESVRFLAHREDMPEVMRSLDVLVLPSLREGFGLVVLEALASGIPVVASRNAGAMEIVKNWPGVFEAEPGNPDSFAREIGIALDLVVSGGVRIGIQPDLMPYTWDASSRKLEAMYDEVACVHPDRRAIPSEAI